MSDRTLDWRAFVNRLIYCFGCGKFGLPRKGGVLPREWSLLYQPHREGPAGLHVCSEKCKAEVREAMTRGPVTEPLAVATNITMTAEMREQMMAEAMAHALKEEGLLDQFFSEAISEVLTEGPVNDGGEEEGDKEGGPEGLQPEGRQVLRGDGRGSPGLGRGPEGSGPDGAA